MTTEASNETAYTCILDGPKETEGVTYYWRLVYVEGGELRTLKETGDEFDPFYVAKGPIWFETREAGMAEAWRRNRDELHISREDAALTALRAVTRRAS